MLVYLTNYKIYWGNSMSCKFNGKISAEFTPPRQWKLEKALSFTVTGHGMTQVEWDILQECGANVANSGRITCKKGMWTDLASVPRIVWNIIAPWDVARAAVIHDHLYATLRDYYHSEGMDYATWKNTLEEMERSVSRAHKCFGHINTLWDQLYMLEVIDYGTLQRNYKCGSG